MYVKGMGEDAIEHDVTPTDGYVDQLDNMVTMGDDFMDGETKEFAGIKGALLGFVKFSAGKFAKIVDIFV